MNVIVQTGQHCSRKQETKSIDYESCNQSPCHRDRYRHAAAGACRPDRNSAGRQARVCGQARQAAQAAQGLYASCPAARCRVQSLNDVSRSAVG